MFVECKEGSEEQFKVRNSSNVVFKEITSDLYYVLKDTYSIFAEGCSVSKTHLIRTFSTKDKVSIIISSGICSNFELGESNLYNRNPFEIGSGNYTVIYKEPWNDKRRKFTGVCENFCSKGKSAFWNIKDEQMLLIDYQDIIGLYPILGEK